jgi:hypothetical protein
LSYEAAPRKLLDAAMLKDIESGVIPSYIVDREYRARFTQGSSGYFKAEDMLKCMIEDGKTPCVEIVGELGAEYVLAIDPSMSKSDSDDHFAMCLMKIVKKNEGKPDERKVGMVVHSYACAGVDLKHHIQYFYYLLTKFNIVYIVCDTSQGDNLDFISMCNESEIFKTKNLELLAINAEFGKEDVGEMVKQIRHSYNKQARRIVQKQFFNSSLKRAANEYLQSCFNFRHLIFAAKAAAHSPTMNAMAHLDIGDIHNLHPLFHDQSDGSSSMYDFIMMQDNLIQLTMQECALIQMKSTPMGHVDYDLPPSMKRDRDPKRPRKDSYTALFLCVWGIKLYLESMEASKEEEVSNYYRPTLI